LKYQEFFGFGRKYFSLELFLQKLTDIDHDVIFVLIRTQEQDKTYSLSISGTTTYYRQIAMMSDDYKILIKDQLLAWNSIMQDSNNLVQLAHQKNWEQLLALHEKRDERLRDFFNEALTQELVTQVQNDLEIIKQQDADIVQMVKNNQSELSAEAQQLQLMKERIKNYVSADEDKL
jgi:hypothetical protein